MKSTMYLSLVLYFCTVKVFSRTLQLNNNAQERLVSDDEVSIPQSVNKIVWTKLEPIPRLENQQEKENPGTGGPHFSQQTEMKFPQSTKNTNVLGEVENNLDQNEKVTEVEYQSTTMFEDGSNDSVDQNEKITTEVQSNAMFEDGSNDSVDQNEKITTVVQSTAVFEDVQNNNIAQNKGKTEVEYQSTGTFGDGFNGSVHQSDRKTIDVGNQSTTLKDVQNDSVNQNDKITTEVEYQSTTIFEDGESNNVDQNENFHNSRTGGELIDNSTYAEIWVGVSDFAQNNFSNNIISNMLNVTENEVLLQTLSNNVTAEESLNFDENILLGEGGVIVTVQEVSTIGFEVLLDAETKQNLILAELLSSQGTFLDENDIFTNIFIDEDPTTGTVNFKVSQDAVNETLMHESPDDFKSAIINVNETETIGNVFNTNEPKDDVEAEIVIPQTMCPEPGWCIFWFIAQDTCAEDSHCLGNRICCKLGCSKTCMEID